MTTWSHEPVDYSCPFCRLQRGIQDDLNRLADVVVVTEHAYARISPKWWPGNVGAVLVIPRAHHENLYAVPVEAGRAVWDLTQTVAVAMRSAYDCEGISTRQHNEPAGGQDVWHLHVHVLARRPGDHRDVNVGEGRLVGPDERLEYADRLAAAIGGERTFG